jgi:hypothetical protein
MDMSCGQQAGQNHNITTVHRSSERLEQVKYLGTTLTNQNSIQEEIKCRLKSGNACYHLFFCLCVNFWLLFCMGL